MALIIKGRKPTGCFDCDYCDKRAYFDGNEWHLGCRLLCMEVSDDGETDERCPIIGEIPDSHGRMIDADALEERAYLVKGVDGRIRTVIELCDIEDAPTVLEATE